MAKKRYIEINAEDTDSFSFETRDTKETITVALFKDKDGAWYAGIRTAKGRTLRKEEYI